MPPFDTAEDSTQPLEARDVVARHQAIDVGQSRAPEIALLAAGMGIQNASVRKLGVLDMTTTVLTLTLTGLAADHPQLSGWWSPTRRRVGAVVTMLAGAAGGALLVLHASTGAALGVATALLVAVVVATVWWQVQNPPESRLP